MGEIVAADLEILDWRGKVLASHAETSDATTSSRKSYEELDQAFAGQLRAYSAGTR